MDDKTISVNIGSYHNLVRYYNCHELNGKKEYKTLVKIIKKLKKVLELVYDKLPIDDFLENILPIVAGSKPKNFTEFGIIVNTGEIDSVKRIVRSSTNDFTYFNDQSKFVVFRLDSDLRATEKISVASPVLIAYRNGYFEMLDVMIINRKIDLCELVQEFSEPSLSELTNVEDLKTYDFVKKYYPLDDFPHFVYGMCLCNNTTEIAVVYAYLLEYMDLFEYFVELEGELKICHEYVWGYIVYHSLNNDKMKIFCYFVQTGLYINRLHLKCLHQSESTNIGFHRNTLLECIYLAGVHIGLEELISLTDKYSENKLTSYLYAPTTLLNLSRMYLRKYFRLILPRNTSIFKVINKLNIPNSMVSLLKMEDFVLKHFNS